MCKVYGGFRVRCQGVQLQLGSGIRGLGEGIGLRFLVSSLGLQTCEGFHKGLFGLVFGYHLYTDS